MKKSMSRLFAFLFPVLLVAGCGNNKNSFPPETDSPPVFEAAIDPRILDSAASFLGAATGKENPITVDNVVFVNSVMGLNDVPRRHGCLYGDLWILLRDAHGVPILDENGCEQPIAREPIAIPALDDDGSPIPLLDDEGTPALDENGAPIYQVTYSDYVPMVIEEFKNGELKCSVVIGYEEYTQALNIGRLNMVRSSLQAPDTLARALEEAITSINAAESVSLDLAGRLVLHSTRDVLDKESGVTLHEPVKSSIEAPRLNLALYQALLVEGRLAGYGVEKIGNEGESIPAPWLELRQDLDLGDLSYLRDGTMGRDHGIDLYNNFADFSAASHSSQKEYSNSLVNFVQYAPLTTNLLTEAPAAETDPCLYFDDSATAWERILGSDDFVGTNIAAFAKYADDARKIIVFTHNIIQDLPEEAEIACLPAMPEYQPPPEDPLGTDPRLLELAASLIGAAANKNVPVNVDAIVFINTLLGVNTLGTSYKGELFKDFWVLLRNEDGVPILNDAGCVQPIASEPLMVPQNFPVLDANDEIIPVFDENGELTFDDYGVQVYTLVPTDYVPLFQEEYMNGATKCVVIPSYENFTQEAEIGRLNCVRSAEETPHVFDRQLIEAFAQLNMGRVLKRDLSGRLVSSVPSIDEDGIERLVDYTIDSPLQNLALYRALMLWGKLEGSVTVKQEGGEATIHLSLKDELDVDTHGLGFLRRGGKPAKGIDRLPNGYADFAGFLHSSMLEYFGIDVDYVQLHDPLEPDFTCSYTDEIETIWERVLDLDGYEGRGIRAFAKHADDARKVINFNHNIIQDISP